MTFKAISLFSGGGGDSQGMINAGIDVIGFVEKDKWAIATHKHNFIHSGGVGTARKCKLIGTDITKIEDSVFEQYTSKVEIIFGGFPCQSFSHGGKKDNKDGRGFLYQEFIRCVNIIKPKIIIGENVKGLLSRKMEDGTLFIDSIIKEFEEIGYTVKYHLFNMRNYGLPQDRQRIIIYGIRNDLKIELNLEKISKEPPVYNRDILESSLERALKVEDKEIIKLIPKGKYIKTSIDDRKNDPPTNLKKCYEKKEISYGKRSGATYSCIIDLDDVARTILSTYGRMPRLFVPVKYKKEFYLRPYTIKELQRIQGFPDSFDFKGNYTQQITQIGNAIPPVFIEKLFRYIIKALEK